MYEITEKLKLYDISVNLRTTIPKKYSKKQRWDICINKTNECLKFCNLMKPYIQGKINQLNLMLEYFDVKNAKMHHKKMKFLNQTNNLIILDKNKLIEKLKHDIPNDWPLELYNEKNTQIKTTDFNDLNYLAGIFDAEGWVFLNKRKQRYLPIIGITNTNKIIISRTMSCLKNNQLPCYIRTRIPTNRNRIRWDVGASGILRTYKVLTVIQNLLKVKKQQVDILLVYLKQRLENEKSVNYLGEETKFALSALSVRNAK